MKPEASNLAGYMRLSTGHQLVLKVVVCERRTEICRVWRDCIVLILFSFSNTLLSGNKLIGEKGIPGVKSCQGSLVKCNFNLLFQSTYQLSGLFRHLQYNVLISYTFLRRCQKNTVSKAEMLFYLQNYKIACFRNMLSSHTPPHSSAKLQQISLTY